MKENEEVFQNRVNNNFNLICLRKRQFHIVNKPILDQFDTLDQITKINNLIADIRLENGTLKQIGSFCVLISPTTYLVPNSTKGFEFGIFS